MWFILPPLIWLACGYLGHGMLYAANWSGYADRRDFPHAMAIALGPILFVFAIFAIFLMFFGVE